ncbi:hypothetical protein K7X08_006673 [Anisodus acutangulus]|uniref:Uncharacterized protein n=1 Tax=Anisodus acutangulus TaxID=402998 RepID=A0A9Q1MVY1_9SOLA|nr:hypothetical protein K7X08_006673 [Anisodus acutangulus]
MATSITGNTKIFNNLNSCSSLSITNIKTHVPIYSLQFPLSFKPNSNHYCINSTRSNSIYGKRRASEHLFRVPIISCVAQDSSETHPESVNLPASNDSSKATNQYISITPIELPQFNTRSSCEMKQLLT